LPAFSLANFSNSPNEPNLIALVEQVVATHDGDLPSLIRSLQRSHFPIRPESPNCGAPKRQAQKQYRHPTHLVFLTSTIPFSSDLLIGLLGLSSKQKFFNGVLRKSFLFDEKMMKKYYH